MVNLTQGQTAPQTQAELKQHQRRLRAEESSRMLLTIRTVFADGCGIEATEGNIDNAVQIYCALLVAEAQS